jgi:DNA-binding LacI/PurR family transcriptional regulator
MSKTNVTIKDIAKQLGLHHTTVSRALRNHPDVNPDTRKLILMAANELNYHPNTFAANLRNRKSNIIGIIVPELHHDFFSSIISEVTNVADSFGFSVMICQSNESVEQENKNIIALIRNRVAGVIASISQFTECDAMFKAIIDAGIPLLFFDRVCPNLAVNKVLVDFYGGARQVIDHLVQQGYRRIAHIAGPSTIKVAVERLRGYKDGLAQHNIHVDESLIISAGFLPENGVLAVERLLALPERPDAIFAANDEVAMGAMVRLREESLSIPGDVAIAGFDNDKISAFTNPPLTTVDIQRAELGKKAVELLLREIQDKAEPEHVQDVLIPTRLVPRASTRRHV